MIEFWFKPKTHGYGAYPTNWKGWAATVAFPLAVLLLLYPFVIGPAASSSAPTLPGIIGSLAVAMIATVAFIKLTRAKTDGEWRWRWGGK